MNLWLSVGFSTDRIVTEHFHPSKKQKHETKVFLSLLGCILAMKAACGHGRMVQKQV